MPSTAWVARLLVPLTLVAQPALGSEVATGLVELLRHFADSPKADKLFEYVDFRGIERAAKVENPGSAAEFAKWTEAEKKRSRDPLPGKGEGCQGSRGHRAAPAPLACET